MAQLSQRKLFYALLALIPLFAACEQAGDINSSVPAEPVNATIAFKPGDVRVVTRRVRGTGGVVMSDFVTGNKTATLAFGKYKLEVPRNAVRKPTRFVMVVLDNDMVGVRLYAFDRDWEPVRSFRAPLTLTLPYDEADAGQLQNAVLRVANVASETDPTVLELVAANTDRKHGTVSAKLVHFSVWSLAVHLSKELSPGID